MSSERDYLFYVLRLERAYIFRSYFFAHFENEELRLAFRNRDFNITYHKNQHRNIVDSEGEGLRFGEKNSV